MLSGLLLKYLTVFIEILIQEFADEVGIGILLSDLLILVILYLLVELLKVFCLVLNGPFLLVLLFVILAVRYEIDL